MPGSSVDACSELEPQTSLEPSIVSLHDRPGVKYAPSRHTTVLNKLFSSLIYMLLSILYRMAFPAVSKSARMVSWDGMEMFSVQKGRFGWCLDRCRTLLQEHLGYQT